MTTIEVLLLITIITLVCTGSSVGTAITYPMCGFIIDRWGWELVFYVNGVLGTIWFVAWCFLVYDSPQEHPRLSASEKEYIISCLKENVSSEEVLYFLASNKIFSAERYIFYSK